jgi:uncharacterized protein (DUF2141 family)
MRSSEGQLLCALFEDPDGFPDGEHAIKGARSKTTKGRATCQFKGLAEGVYALAVFHDEDGNGDMDTILGIPKSRGASDRVPRAEPRAPSAGAVLFFCVDWSRFVTGTYLPACGGTQMI